MSSESEDYAEKLKPCPFCGSSSVELDPLGDRLGEWARCLKCCGMGPDGDTRAEAAKRWNTRPAPAAEQARCEVCDWTLARDAADGCVPGNCSYRPPDGTPEYYRIRQRREELAKRRAAAEQAPDVECTPEMVAETSALIERLHRERERRLGRACAHPKGEGGHCDAPMPCAEHAPNPAAAEQAAPVVDALPEGARLQIDSLLSYVEEAYGASRRGTMAERVLARVRLELAGILARYAK